MVRFIHTSDLHLGKRFGQFPEDLRGRLTEARHQSITNLAELSRSQGAEFILVAGDVFDTGTPSPSVIRQAMRAMAADQATKWVIIPGNHDSLSSDELWKQVANDRPENVLLGLESKPIEITPATFILPAPCLNRRPGRDLTEWMSDANIAGEGIRIGLAHGAVQSFGEEGASEVIAPDRAKQSGLHYLALGDWHGQISINERTWYSGTPEPDRFKHSEPGKALVVEIKGPGAIPVVQPLETGSFNWQKQAMHILSGEDVGKQLDDILPEVSLRRSTLLQIVVEGRIRIPDRLDLDEEIRKVAPDFALFEARSEALASEYEVSDLDVIDQAGALRQAAEGLMREAEADSDPHGVSASALSMLFTFAAEEA
ncbi:DNA repair exonuclease [Sulfitobacter sp. SK012]|uniref:metallophosphoesterase family protein n=1 Tax=Sulfitobacter sp. SK012 TaxID=1389005 RepID=UPI000E0C3C4E|nr:DNA repair exonuclease [Sulfitobacter sp. SK012]AXI45847.1 DNA repair exonuclease [Sulfitobacter sp. SK012]